MDNDFYELLLKLGTLLARIANVVLPPSHLQTFCGLRISHYSSSFFVIILSSPTHAVITTCSSKKKSVQIIKQTWYFILFPYLLIYLGQYRSRLYGLMRHVFSVWSEDDLLELWEAVQSFYFYPVMQKTSVHIKFWEVTICPPLPKLCGI